MHCLASGRKAWKEKVWSLVVSGQNKSRQVVHRSTLWAGLHILVSVSWNYQGNSVCATVSRGHFWLSLHWSAWRLNFQHAFPHYLLNTIALLSRHMPSRHSDAFTMSSSAPKGEEGKAGTTSHQLLRGQLLIFGAPFRQTDCVRSDLYSNNCFPSHPHSPPPHLTRNVH